MYVYKLHLKPNRQQEKELELRFYLMWRTHVALVKHAQKLLRILTHSLEYQALTNTYRDAGKALETLEKERADARAAETRNGHRRIREITTDIKETKAVLKNAGDAMNTIRMDMGLTEFALQEYAKVQQHKYANHLQSQEVQKEASRIWRGVEKVLFGNGKKLRIPRLNGIRSICGKQKDTGIRFRLDHGSVLWNGMELPCGMEMRDGKAYPRNPYEAIALGNDFSFCEIVRLPFPMGYRYYLHVYMKGEAPDATPGGPAKSNGIDPGVSTMAAVSENGDCALEELAPDVKRYNRKIKKWNTKLEAERRRSNPDNYLPDGRIRKGKKVWVRTAKYNRIEMLLRSWYRKKSGYVRTAHGTLANQMLRNGVHILVEKMNYRALAKRSRKTEKQEKTTTVTKKDGDSIEIRKYKRKKRFGKSLNNRSPALFLRILEKKALSSGGSYREVNTRKLCASQYDHIQDKNIKVRLNCRIKEIGGRPVQRDLYSAFIISNVKDDLSTPDREKCKEKFNTFMEKHDQLIEEIKAKKRVRPACFGF